MKPAESTQPLPTNSNPVSPSKTSAHTEGNKDGYRNIYITIPPDGGYGWFVASAAFFVVFITDGTAATFGYNIPYLKEDLHNSSALISVAGALLFGFYFLAAPFAAALANQVGSRMVVIIGSIISSAGLVIASFMPSIEYICLTYGVMVGIGFSMMFMPSVVMVGLYFDKRRTLVTCLSTMGSGVGIITLSPLYAYLLEKIEWRNTWRVQSGIALCGIFLGLIFRPVKPKKMKVPDEHVQFPKHTDGKKGPSVADLLASNPNLFVEDVTKEDGKARAADFYRDDIFYDGSLYRLPEYGRKKSIVDSLYHYKVIRIPASVLTKGVRRFICPPKMKDIIANMLDFSLLKSPSFMVQSWSGLFYSVGYNVPPMYVKVRNQQNGMSVVNADFLLMMMGIFNLVTRVICGVVASHPKASALQLRNFLVIIGGLSTLVSMLDYSAIYQYVYMGIYGMSLAGFMSLRSVILVETNGLEKLSNGFGLLLMFQAFGVVIGTPLAGVLKGITGNYDISFWYSGTAITLSGVIMIPLSCIAEWERQKKRRISSR